MAEETAVGNEDFSDAQTLDITGDELSEAEKKVEKLSKKLVDLEKQKQDLIDWTKGLNAEVELLKRSLDRAGVEKVDLKRQIENLESEKRSLDAVAARAAELEAEVSRLQHELVSALSDVQELNNEASGWKTKAEGLESGDKAKSVELDAVKKERDSLIGKLAASKAKELEKEEQVRNLEKKIEEKKDLERGLAEAKRLEKELLVKIELLEEKLKDVESLNVELEGKQLARDGIPNGESGVVREEYGESAAVEARNKKRASGIGGFNVDLRLVAVSTVGAVGVAGLLCYLHAAAKKQ